MTDKPTGRVGTPLPAEALPAAEIQAGPEWEEVLARRPPPRPLRLTIKTLDGISFWTGHVAAWLVIPMTLALVYEVFARYFFRAPTAWAYDVTYMFYGTLFMLGAAYTLYRQGHIRTDIFYNSLPVRYQALLDAVLYLFFFLPAIGIFFWFAWDFARESWRLQERIVTSPWLPIVYPFKTVMPVAAGLLLLQGVSEFLKSLYVAVTGEGHGA